MRWHQNPHIMHRSPILDCFTTQVPTDTRECSVVSALIGGTLLNLSSGARWAEITWSPPSWNVLWKHPQDKSKPMWKLRIRISWQLPNLGLPVTTRCRSSLPRGKKSSSTLRTATFERFTAALYQGSGVNGHQCHLQVRKRRVGNSKLILPRLLIKLYAQYRVSGLSPRQVSYRGNSKFQKVNAKYRERPEALFNQTSWKLLYIQWTYIMPLPIWGLGPFVWSPGMVANIHLHGIASHPHPLKNSS